MKILIAIYYKTLTPTTFKAFYEAFKSLVGTFLAPKCIPASLISFLTCDKYLDALQVVFLLHQYLSVHIFDRLIMEQNLRLLITVYCGFWWLFYQLNLWFQLPIITLCWSVCRLTPAWNNKWSRELNILFAPVQIWLILGRQFNIKIYCVN